MKLTSTNVGICDRIDLLHGIYELEALMDLHQGEIYHTAYMAMSETLTFIEEYINTHKVEINKSIDLQNK